MSEDFDELKARRDRLKLEKEVRGLEKRAKLDSFLANPFSSFFNFFYHIRKESPVFFWLGLAFFVILSLSALG